ncbi:MAG: stage II sporulation protein M [Myxococcota bacterium]
MSDLNPRLDQFTHNLERRDALSDEEWLALVDSHRWAVGQLARSSLSSAERLRLNSSVLAGHRWLHRTGPRIGGGRLRSGLLRVTRPFLWSWLCFAAGAIIAASAVLVDPAVVYSVVPRALLAQIAESAWGERSNLSAGLGMTLFYSANNSRACLLALGFGILGGVPGLAVIAYNGAILGAVAAHAAHLGLFGNLVAWLGPHGVAELSAMMLSAAIGWALALAWMQPAQLSRRASLAEAGNELTPLVGVAVLLVLVAAPFEGFISPLPLPLWADGLIAFAWCAVLFGAARAVLSLPHDSCGAATNLADPER